MSKLHITVPDVGSDSEVEVIEILVSTGDELAIDDPILVLESDKASIEVPASEVGQISSIEVKIGDKVKQGDVLLYLESGEAPVSEPDHAIDHESAPTDQQADEDQDQRATSTEVKTSSVQAFKEIHVPDVGGSEAVEVIELSAEPGSTIEADGALLVLESDKASMDIPSPYSGTLIEFKVAVGDKVAEGDLIAVVEVNTSEREVVAEPKQAGERQSELKAPITAPVEEKRVSVRADTASESDVHAGPAVRKLARELGVELSRVKPTGVKGRIQKDDLTAYIKAQVQVAQTGNAGSSAFTTPPLPDFSQFGEVEVLKMDRMHQLTAKNMHISWSNIPHVTQFDEADITELERFRKSKKSSAEQRGVKLTPLPFLIKACALVLRDLPQFNVSLDLEHQQVIQKKYINIGVAVDTAHGLVVPVIRNAVEKSLWEISKELGELADKAKNRKLSPQDMQGACFTISSLGSIGGTAFTPIVNLPEVAILGVSKAALKPVYIENDFVPRLILPLSLSYDHRAVNGADAARFTTALGKYLSDIREFLF